MVMLRRHPNLAILFVLLNCADLALTCHLLRVGCGAIYEANWLAGAVLARYGLVGLAIFKALIVLFAATLVGIIAARRPRAARGLAVFGCLAVGIVVLYSLAIWGHLAAEIRSSRQQTLAAIERAERAVRTVTPSGAGGTGGILAALPATR
ncbi:MAG TPA: DUF5658 family protein [Gemmataceae bacterium]|nr:DUF5658 family protein [Gemmataceae bacterium]